MKYTMDCPAGDKVLEVDAASDDEAVTMLMDAAKSHMMEAHPDMEGKSDEDLKAMVSSGMKKVEAEAEAEPAA